MRSHFILVAICVFDWAVNAGVKQEIKTLQDYLEVESDVKFGSVIEAALHKAIEQELQKQNTEFSDLHIAATLNLILE